MIRHCDTDAMFRSEPGVWVGAQFMARSYSLNMCLLVTDLSPFLLAGDLEGGVIVSFMGNQVFRRLRVFPKAAEPARRQSGHPTEEVCLQGLCLQALQCAPGRGVGDWGDATTPRAVTWEADNLWLILASVAPSKLTECQRTYS